MIEEVWNCKTPENWCEELLKLGIVMSARTLRAKAREYGQYYALGRAMLLHPKHIDKIFKEEACRLNSLKEMKSTGFGDGSKNYRVANTTDKALVSLQRQAQGQS